MADHGLMTPMEFKDSEGNAYRFPAGLWLGALILSLPDEWRDELCHTVGTQWEALKSEAQKPKLYIAGSIP